VKTEMLLSSVIFRTIMVSLRRGRVTLIVTYLRICALTLYRHIKTVAQWTIMQQDGDWYTGRWSVAVLLRLVQRGGDWSGPQPAQAPPHCTKYNNSPIR